jgi:aminopeptidase N
MDKWFALHATRRWNADRLKRYWIIRFHNQPRWSAPVGAFAMSNPTGFHEGSGAGYRFVADRVIELQGINPQIAARIASAFNHWKRHDPLRSHLMQTELQRIAATPELASDVAEILHNALG